MEKQDLENTQRKMYLLQVEINTHLLKFLRELALRCNGSVQHAINNQYKPSKIAMDTEMSADKEYDWLKNKMNELEELRRQML